MDLYKNIRYEFSKEGLKVIYENSDKGTKRAILVKLVDEYSVKDFKKMIDQAEKALIRTETED